MRRWVFLLWLPLVACGNSTGPSPQIPSVVGNYSGNTVMTFVEELPARVTCPTTTSVTQSGSTVNVAPLILGGDCGGVSVPFGQVAIDATGNIQGASNGTFEKDCGRYTYSATGGFFGPDLRLGLNATSTTCDNIHMTISLTR